MGNLQASMLKKIGKGKRLVAPASMVTKGFHILKMLYLNQRIVTIDLYGESPAKPLLCHFFTITGVKIVHSGQPFQVFLSLL